MQQQAALQVTFKVGNRQVEKFDQVAVIKQAGSVGMNLSHQWWDFCRAEDDALKKDRVELPLQLALASFFLRRHLEVELAFFRALAAAEDDEVLRPGQLCQQRCH